MQSKKVFVVLDDQPILAMGMAEDLADMGVGEARAFGSPEDLADFVKQERPAFALLDFKLDRGRTSKEMALRLKDANVPVAFATGFGEVPDKDPRLADIPSFYKPLERDKLKRHLETMNLI